MYASDTGKEHTYGYVLKVTFDFETIITGFVSLKSGTYSVVLYSEVAGEQMITETNHQEQILTSLSHR